MEYMHFHPKSVQESFGISCTDYSQSSVDDDRVRFDWEAKNSGVFWRVSECDLLAFCIFFWEKADFRNAVILERQKKNVLNI